MENPPKILIVDDEMNILKAIKRLFMEYNLEVFMTTSPEEALEIVNTNSIDLIISDQRMPTMEGIELLSQIKEISPSTIRILMSGYADIEVFIAAINNGSIFHYISKPWENEKTIKVVLNALENKSHQDQQEKILKHLFKEKNKWKEFVSQGKVERRRDLLNNIIHNQVVITTDIVNEAKTLDIDMTAPLFCCILSINKEFFKTTENSKDHEMNLRLMSEIIFLLCLVPNCLAWDSKDRIGIIHHADTVQDQGTVLKQVSSVKKILKEHYPNLQYTMAISNINIGIDSVKKSYDQAQGALVTAENYNTGVSNTTYFREIGVMQLLTTLQQQTAAKEFVEENLGNLIQYDEAKGGEFVRTLEELLKNDNLKAAATNLFIHPKTIVFRRNRIEEILGVSLEDYETRLSLGIAIKLYRMRLKEEETCPSNRP